jgi:hypothetical protein
LGRPGDFFTWGAPKLNLGDEKAAVAPATIFKADRLSMFLISLLDFFRLSLSRTREKRPPSGND